MSCGDRPFVNKHLQHDIWANRFGSKSLIFIFLEFYKRQLKFQLNLCRMSHLHSIRAYFVLLSWKLRLRVSPKHRFTYKGLDFVTMHLTKIFTITANITSNCTHWIPLLINESLLPEVNVQSYVIQNLSILPLCLGLIFIIVFHLPAALVAFHSFLHRKNTPHVCLFRHSQLCLS
jgi:hypothetical protein